MINYLQQRKFTKYMRGNLLRRRYLTPRSLFRNSNRLNELPAVRYIEFTINLIGRPSNDFFTCQSQPWRVLQSFWYTAEHRTRISASACKRTYNQPEVQLSVTQGNAQCREVGVKFHLSNMRCHFSVLLVKRKKKLLVHNPESNLGLTYTTLSNLPLMDALL